MPTQRSADVLVVGAGLIGLALARRLANEGARVVVLESGALESGGPGRGASFAAAGILAAQIDMPGPGDALTELSLASRDRYGEFANVLAAETGIDVQHWRSGLLYVATSEEGATALARRHRWQTEQGLPVHALSSAEARGLEPRLRPDVAGALHFPDEASIDNVRLLEAVRVSCARLGVRLVTGCVVRSVVERGGRTVGVESSAGPWSAPDVVLAAGSWSGQVETPLPKPLETTPVRGQMLALRSPSPLFDRIIFSENAFIVPRRDGRLLLGSTIERVGYDASVTAEGLLQILSGASALSAAVGALPVVDAWAGLRPACPGDAPVVGATPVDGLYVATGHFRNGILLAPATADLLADWILRGEPPPLLERFAPV